MMLASPMMLAYASDVLLRKIIGKHRIIASETSNIIMNEVNNIIFEQSEKNIIMNLQSIKKFARFFYLRLCFNEVSSRRF